MGVLISKHYSICKKLDTARRNADMCEYSDMEERVKDIDNDSYLHITVGPNDGPKNQKSN